MIVAGASATNIDEKTAFCRHGMTPQTASGAPVHVLESPVEVENMNCDPNCADEVRSDSARKDTAD